MRRRLTSNVSDSFRRYGCCGGYFSSIGAGAGIDDVCDTLEDVSVTVPRGVKSCTAFKLSNSGATHHFKIEQDLTRFAIQAKGPDGKWTRKPLAYRESNNVHLLITRPPEICVNLVFKHIHAASSYTICRQFVPFIYCPL